jgi:outer membrane protein TolC
MRCQSVQIWGPVLLLGGLIAPAWAGPDDPALPLPAAPAAPYAATLPINLPTALRLADAQAIDIALASERIRIAVAQFDRAKVLWLPTIQLGGDYFRQDGQIQDVVGNVFGTSKSTLMAGAAPIAIFAVTDAIFEPLAARQVVQSREATRQAVANDTLLSVAEAYFNVQQARGELAGAVDAVRRAEEVERKAAKLAPEYVPQVEVARTRTELARRRQAVYSAQERWRFAAAELTRLLRLEPTALVEPMEPPCLEVSLVPPGHTVDEMVAQALTRRPELAAQQALVQATLRRLKEEKLRPLIPSVLLRGAATNPAGTLSSGVFGGGTNEHLGNFSMRNTMDLQILWEFQNLGFGNLARIKEREAEQQAAVLEFFRIQDRVAAEVVQAYAQVESAASRIGDAELGLREAVESATQNIEGMSQTKRTAGNLILLVIRPQEAVASVQALAQAYADYYGAVADYNRAQFRLYRALGKPAQEALQEGACPEDTKPN